MEKDHVMSRRSAVQAVDSQANPPGRKRLAEDSPPGVGIVEAKSRGLEVLIGQPERDRGRWSGNLDDDRNRRLELR